MLKQTLILAAVLGCVMSWTIPERYQPIAKDVLENCAGKTNTDIKFITKLREATELPAVGSEDETKYKSYNLCGYVHTGLLKDGVFQDDVAGKMMKGLEDIYNKPFNACKGTHAESEIETAWQITRCFHDNMDDKKNFFLY